MAPFDYNYQNLHFFCFLMVTKATFTKFEFERENEMNSGCCSQMTPS